MMPVISHTQVPLPTQVSLVATALPGTSALRVLPDAVAPSVSNAAILADHKGNGGYTPISILPATSSPLSSPLSVLVPAAFSTSSASLSASAMFATQLLSQNGGGAELLETYEAMAQAAQVKFMPSNAGQPEPAPNNLFAKILADTRTQETVRAASQTQQAVQKEVAAQMPQPALSGKITLAQPKQRPSQSATAPSPAMRHASEVYTATSVRNNTLLKVEEAEPVVA